MKTAALNNKDILSHKLRFEAEHYLNDNSFLCLALERNKDNCDTLENLATVFNPPVFKRQFCKPTSRSVQYFQSSDVQNAEEFSPVHIFKGQAESLNLLVNKGDVLVTGFGTIGNTRLVSKHQDGVCYANNVCRIRANNNIPNGFIYAFMTSKYGYAQLNNNASGSVVRYIEAPGIKRTLVPRLSDSFQKEVDDLIQESARLREEATEALEEAKILIEEQFKDFKASLSQCSVSSKDILSSHNKRFEANYHIAEGKSIEDYIKAHFKWDLLGNLCSSISRPELFKRYYVQNGLPFLGGADLFLASPKSSKQLSKTKTSNIESLVLKEGTILLPRSGTIGDVAWAHYGHAQKLASEHVIRLLPNNILREGYIYAFLASAIGKSLIQRHIFGSVIQHIEPPHLKLIPVPIFDNTIIETTHSKVLEYSKKTGEAIQKEDKAISMVEQEIEKWNKN